MSENDSSVGPWELRDGGVRVLRQRVRAAVMSPDDGWLAIGHRNGWRLVEVASGRVSLNLGGTPVVALAWLSNELLLVVRERREGGCRAMVHAVPDGGLVASVAMEAMNTETCTITLSARGWDGAVTTAWVAPARWHGGARGAVRRRLGYLLTSDDHWASAVAVDPEAWTVLPRLPEVRPVVLSLTPEGEGLVGWMGEPDPQRTGGAQGWVVRVPSWRTMKPEVVCRAGLAVRALRPSGAGHWVLRGAVEESPTAVGEVVVVDTFRAMVLYDSLRDSLGAWPGGWGTVAGDANGQRVVVVGRGTEGKGALAAGVIDVETGTRRSALTTLKGNLTMGGAAAFVGDEGNALAVVVGASAKQWSWTAWRNLHEGVAVKGDAEWMVPVVGKVSAPPSLARSPAGEWMVLTWEATGKLGEGEHKLDRLGFAFLRRSTLEAVVG